MVKLISFYEDQWMPPGTDRAQFEALALAYGADFQLIRSWDEAVLLKDAPIILVDEEGSEESATFRHPPRAVYVFGRSGQRLMPEVRVAAFSVHVATPMKKSLFGISAASIIMRDRQRA